MNIVFNKLNNLSTFSSVVYSLEVDAESSVIAEIKSPKGNVKTLTFVNNTEAVSEITITEDNSDFYTLNSVILEGAFIVSYNETESVFTLKNGGYISMKDIISVDVNPEIENSIKVKVKDTAIQDLSKRFNSNIIGSSVGIPNNEVSMVYTNNNINFEDITFVSGEYLGEYVFNGTKLSIRNIDEIIPVTLNITSSNDLNVDFVVAIQYGQIDFIKNVYFGQNLTLTNTLLNAVINANYSNGVKRKTIERLSEINSRIIAALYNKDFDLADALTDNFVDIAKNIIEQTQVEYFKSNLIPVSPFANYDIRNQPQP